MDFYTEPAFYIIVAALLVPSVIAGLTQRSLRTYGLVISVIMVVLLFFRNLEGACAFGIFMVVSSATTFITLRLFNPPGKDAEPHPHAVGIYRVLLAVALIPIVCAKVSAIFDTNLLGFLGISYLTFKNVQVLIEIRDRLIKELSFTDYVYFMIFFPVFTSGPIMRSQDFVKQIHQTPSSSEYRSLLADGIAFFVRGVVYKFVFAAFFQWLQWIAPTYIGADTAGMFVLGQCAQGFCYGLWLFFDFAGYTIMAMGLGALLGIRVPPNFNAPFRSIDIKDFWNRWNMTLSFWLRDYVFMRMLRSFIKAKRFKSRTTTACVGFITEMTLMGAWHGLTVDFLLYGIYHGCLLALCELFQKKTKIYKQNKNKRWFKTCSWAITMVAVFFGFALFSGQVTTLIGGMLHG